MAVRKFVLVLAAISVMAPAARAQDAARDGFPDYDLQVNDLVTQSIVRDLASVRGECLKAEREYRLDCIRQGLELTSRRTPYHGDYGPMREVLRSGASSIAPIIDESADDAKDRLEVKPGANPRFKSRRYYTPVAAGRYEAVKADAFKALDATQSGLLERAKGSAGWNRAYTTVAIAVASLADVLRK